MPEALGAGEADHSSDLVKDALGRFVLVGSLGAEIALAIHAVPLCCATFFLC
jgi:hypothetical protein